MKYNRSSAFTFAEIIIVLAIIGLLAAITIPNYMKARELSWKNKARTAAEAEHTKVYQVTLMALTASISTNTIDEAEQKASAAAKIASNTVYRAVLEAAYPNLTSTAATSK